MADREITFLPVKLVKPFLDRAREPVGFRELRDSIADIGLKIPISVRPINKRKTKKEIKRYGRGNWKYEVVKGHGRLRAFRELGLEEVPAFTLTDLSDRNVVRLFLIENEVRHSLPAYERARLMKLDRDTQSSGFTELADKYGTSVATVKKDIATLEQATPKVRSALKKGKVSLGDASALSTITKKEQDLLLSRGGLKSKKMREAVKVVKNARHKGIPIDKDNVDEVLEQSAEEANTARREVGRQTTLYRLGPSVIVDLLDDPEVAPLLEVITGIDYFQNLRVGGAK